LLIGVRGHEADDSLTVLRREDLSRLDPESDTAFAAAEVLARARLTGLTTAEVGVPRGPRPARPAGSLGGTLGSVASLLRFWWSRLLISAPPPVCVAPARSWFWAGLLLLSLLSGFLFFGNLSYPLLEPDEGRYAEVVREMVVTGDWVVPRLHHVPFYDKPLLFYWLVGGSYRAFGVSEAAARLVPALAAFLTVLACFVLGRRLVGARPAFLAAVVLALMPVFVQCGRVVILDSLLTLFVTLSLFTAYEAMRGQRLGRAWWATSAVCCALGVMTKGPVALVLLGPPVVAHAWLRRSPARPGLRHWAAYGTLVFALVAPSYIVLIVRDPRFAYHFFIDQHLVRFFLHNYHVQPAWYYVPIVLIGLLPWSLLTVPLVRFLFDSSAEARSARSGALGFFLLWAAWCVLFFSASSSKLPPYILPALPAVALLVGCFLDRVLFGRAGAALLQEARTLVPRGAALVLAVAWLVVSIGAWKRDLLGPAPALVHAGLCCACLFVLGVGGRKLPARAGWLLSSGLAALVIVGVTHQVIPAWASRRSPLTRHEEIARLARAERTPVACYDGEWGSVPFYVGETDRVVHLPGRSPSEIVWALIREPRYLVVVRHKADLEQFRRVSPHMQMTKTLFADEIGVGLLEAQPWWKQVLGAAGKVSPPLR
jgi:dolichol-phosphate mannosyltransferase